MPSKELLKWISDSFTAFYPKDMPLPCIYPALDGGLSLEWSNPNMEISLLIPPDHQECALSILDGMKGEHREQSISLGDDEGKSFLSNAIRTLLVGVGK